MTANLFDDERITAIGLLAEAYTGLTARFAAQFAEHDLSQVEFEVLIRLARSTDHQLRMTDLAAQTSLSTSGVTRVVDRMERDGADMVGMTAMPEAALAREAGLAYAALVVVVNWAAGRADSRGGIAMEEIGVVLERSMVRICRILQHVEVGDGRAAGT